MPSLPPLPVPDLTGPYDTWIYGPGRKYALPLIREGHYRYLAALIERAPGAPPPVGKGLAYPTLWASGDPAFHPHWLPAVVDCTAKGKAAAHHGAMRLNLPVPEDSYDPGFVPAPPPQLKPKPGAPLAVVAVIDDGIPFVHDSFRDSKGKSRVDYTWLQGAPADPKGKAVLFGHEYTGEEADSLLAACGRDEDLFYARYAKEAHNPPYGHPIRDFASHGAHVADAAARYAMPDEQGFDTDRLRVIAVQLPTPLTLDTAGFGKDAMILAALHYVFERADRIAAAHGLARLPVVVNLSYGFTGGLHDGSDRLEAAMQELVAERRKSAPTALVVPTGNSFVGALTGFLSSDRLKGQGYAIPLRVQPNDRTSQYMELWAGGVADVAGFHLRIAPPRGPAVDWSPGVVPVPSNPLQDPMVVTDLKDAQGRIIGQLSADFYRRQHWRLMVILAPTEPDDPSDPPAQAGLWQVNLRHAAPPPGATVRARIQRDSDPLGYIRGARQAYFDDLADDPFNPDGTVRQTDTPGAFMRRFGAISTLATGAATTRVAGFIENGGKPANYSGAGEAGFGAQVLAAAASDRSTALQGWRGAATRSGATFAMTGTSNAAPKASRALARDFLTLPASEVKKAEGGNYVALLEKSGYRTEPVTKDKADRLGARKLFPAFGGVQ